MIAQVHLRRSPSFILWMLFVTSICGVLAAAEHDSAHAKHVHRTAPIDFTIRSATSGNWSDAKTWQPARVPNYGDRVLVSRGTRVVYDVMSEAKMRLVQVVGTLSFARGS